VKTVSDKVVRHSLAYQSTWKFGGYWPILCTTTIFNLIIIIVIFIKSTQNATNTTSCHEGQRNIYTSNQCWHAGQVYSYNKV